MEKTAKVIQEIQDSNHAKVIGTTNVKLAKYIKGLESTIEKLEERLNDLENQELESRIRYIEKGL